MLVKFSAKAQGKSHIEKDLHCQDAADAWLKQSGMMGIAFVADGHGGEKYFRSQKGSDCAVKVAKRSLFDFYNEIENAVLSDKKPEAEENQEIINQLKQLEGNIIYKWRNAVKKDLTDNPLSDQEKEICVKNNIAFDEPSNLIKCYGTTLLAALVSESFWFALQIGDGLCVVLDEEGGAKTPIPEDDRLGFGRTTSLCDSNAIDNFRESFGFNAIRGITLATDGVSDSFIPEAYLQFIKEKIYESFIHTSPEKAEADLQEFLPKLSEDGSKDDVAIAGIFRMEDKPVACEEASKDTRTAGKPMHAPPEIKTSVPAAPGAVSSASTAQAYQKNMPPVEEGDPSTYGSFHSSL